VSAQAKDVTAPLAEPQKAVAEVLAGRPGPTARRWLGPTALVVFVLFAIDTYLVVANDVLPFDVPIARFVQGLNWGPVVYPMELINASAGIWQVLIGAVAVVALFILERRACSTTSSSSSSPGSGHPPTSSTYSARRPVSATPAGTRCSLPG
jgi:hypothetical protein